MNNEVLMDKRIRLLIIIVVLLIAGFIAWEISLSVSRRGLDKVTVQALPDDSKISMDGQSITNGTHYITPGVHTFKATRQYFDPDTEKINTADYKNGDTLYLLPAASSQQALDWLSKHPDVQQARESAAGTVAEKLQEKLLAEYPIIKQLPTFNSHYKIDYSTDGGKLSFQITLYPIINGPNDYGQYKSQLQQYKDEALQFLKDNHINPSNYFISYTPNPDQY